jgi:hypothetical protein
MYGMGFAELGISHTPSDAAVKGRHRIAQKPDFRRGVLCGLMLLFCSAQPHRPIAMWNIATAVTQRDANAEAARWQAWGVATCGDQSPRRIVVAGKPVC